MLERDREVVREEEPLEPVEPNWKREYRKEGKLISTITKEELPEYAVDSEQDVPEMLYVYPLDKNFLSKIYFFSLRVKDIRRRKSDYSDPISLEAQICPLPPQNIKAAVFSDKVVVQWDPPEKNIDQSSPSLVEGYNIFRSVKEAKPVRLNSALILGQTYEDKNFTFGTVYRYFVRASATAALPYLESGDSEELEVIPKDTFSPAPPKGLVIVAGTDILSLSWDANTEKDLAGYRVWRRTEKEAGFVVLTEEPIMENAYTDTAVEKKVRYYYAITSLDKNGNESLKSETISEIIRDGQDENLPF
ncbi:MAG: hypothetical protein PVF22_03235 [Candidatus Aminicenantes bacterium]